MRAASLARGEAGGSGQQSRGASGAPRCPLSQNNCKAPQHVTWLTGHPGHTWQALEEQALQTTQGGHPP